MAISRSGLTAVTGGPRSFARRSLAFGIGALALAWLVASGARPGVAQDKPGTPPAPAEAKSTFREYPIGDEVEREAEHLKVAAVWLPPVTMDHEHDHAAPGPWVIHLECDIHASRGNTHGFAVGDWIPYLSIKYRVAAEGAKPDAAPLLEGKLMPMVAKDGPHYGATIAMPGPGKYTLTYDLEPPSANGLGRHTDPITGVAEWWKPFETTYTWDYKGVPADKSEAPGGR